MIVEIGPYLAQVLGYAIAGAVAMVVVISIAWNTKGE